MIRNDCKFYEKGFIVDIDGWIIYYDDCNNEDAISNFLNCKGCDFCPYYCEKKEDKDKDEDIIYE